MVQQKKIFTVANLAQKIKDAKALYLADYRGLDVSQMTELRREIKKTGGELEVSKNRLLKLALKEVGRIDDLANFELTGPTAILWANEDEISPLKTLVRYGKEWGLLESKFGFLGEDFIPAENVKELALVPTKKALEAKLVGGLFSPISRLNYALFYNLQKLVFVLKSASQTL